MGRDGENWVRCQSLLWMERWQEIKDEDILEGGEGEARWPRSPGLHLGVSGRVVPQMLPCGASLGISSWLSRAWVTAGEREVSSVRVHMGNFRKEAGRQEGAAFSLRRGRWRTGFLMAPFP